MVPNPPAGGEESEVESQVAYFLAGEIDHVFSYKVLGACCKRVGRSGFLNIPILITLD